MRTPSYSIPGPPSRSTPFGRRPWATVRAEQVGFLGLHAPDDVVEEINALHTDMMTFGGGLFRQLFYSPEEHKTKFGFERTEVARPGIAQEQVDFYRNVWRPLMAEWIAFRDKHDDSFWQNLPLSGAYDRVQDYRQRFLSVRAQAPAMQLKVIGPEPIAPKHDPDLPAGAGEVLKIAAYVGIGVAGLIALSHLSKSGGPT